MAQLLNTPPGRYEDLFINKLYLYVLDNYGEDVWNTMLMTEVHSHTLEYFIDQYGKLAFKEIVDTICEITQTKIANFIIDFSQTMKYSSL